MDPKISVDENRCNGCGNCMIVCPESVSLHIELMGGKGASGDEITLAVTDGSAHFFDEKICKRNFSTAPFQPCRCCLDACPMSAIIYPKKEGFDFLEHEVISQGNCSGCGMCAAICPEKVIVVDEAPELQGDCINCGYCVSKCPRIYFSYAEIEKKIFGSYPGDLLGPWKANVAAKTTVEDILACSQDGGFVTTALKYAFENHIIDGAIVTGTRPGTPWKPQPILATSVEEILSGAGSKYSNSPNLSLLKTAEEKGLKALAIVGLPCHIEGFRNAEMHPLDDMNLGRIVKFSIGLFCKTNFKYEELRDLLEQKCGFTIDKVTKLSIKGKNFSAESANGTTKFPLKDASACIKEGCKSCRDFTSKLSDFSVGAVGSPKGYSTVIARTDIAVDILEGMQKAGLITTKELDPSWIKKVQFLAEMKDKEATRTLAEKTSELVRLSTR
jgi:coenzyme F420 hydrogenase subunit beta